MPRVTGSSSGSEIQTTEIKADAFSGKFSGIPFGPLYPTLRQLSLGVLFRDEFWKRVEPQLEGIISPRI